MSSIYENQMATVGSLIARGIILLIIGVLFAIFTGISTGVLAILVAIFLIIIGISLIGGSTMFNSTGLRVVGIILGILLIICGILGFFFLNQFANIITYIIAVVAFIAGVYELIGGIVGASNRVSRPLSIISGIIAILFAIFIFIWPLLASGYEISIFGAAFGLTFIVGIFLVIYGILLIIGGIVLKVKTGKAVKTTVVKDN